MKVETFRFADDGDIPNSRLPLIVYRGALAARGDVASSFEARFASHGWGRMWRNSVFPFHHYHSNTHEVLGIAAGAVTLRMGGEVNGATLEAVAGDALLIPAGVGHKRLSDATGLVVVGAYPPGAPAYDLWREGAEEKDRIRAKIAGVPLPKTDPIDGESGAVFEVWR